MDLNEFQSALWTALEAELSSRKLHYSTDWIAAAEVDGHLLVRCTGGVEAFIYVDEAEWRLGMRWQPFELPDFDSPEDLISQFVAEVVKVASTGFPPQKSAGSTGLYFRSSFKKR